MKNSKSIPVMDYQQYRKMRRLEHKFCNYDDGFCIALDDGEKCVCVQSISYSLICKWFRAAVLPMDQDLEAALFPHLGTKQCAVCGKRFLPGSNRAKYCSDCTVTMKRHNTTKRKRRQRSKCHALAGKKPL
ncbi:MAG: cysteine-rich VLP domain-containing protein [Faecousia sp.]